MKTAYHITITQTVLSDKMSDEALESITTANINQDNWRGQFGHPEFHFDDSTFGEGNRYIEEQRKIAYYALSNGDQQEAWCAFGRLLHSAQDFYAHSNYVHLWVLKYLSAAVSSGKFPISDQTQGNEKQITTEFMHTYLHRNTTFDTKKIQKQIQPLDDEILSHPALFSGQIYMPWDFLYYLPVFNPIIAAFIPNNSHAKMNLDSPESGALFEIAISAAIKRSRHEFSYFLSGLSPVQQTSFTGKKSTA